MLTCKYDPNEHRYCVLHCWFCSQKSEKISYAACSDILGQNSTLEINIKGMIPENCQFLVDDINRGLVKPSVLLMQYA